MVLTSTVAKSRSAGRRAEYAEQTRQAVIEAARKLFTTKGYTQTKVDDIAALARVSPMTIYSALGGKTGLLRALMDLCTTEPGTDIAKALEDIRLEREPKVVIDIVARTVCEMRERYADIVYLVHDAAPHDAEVTANLAIATERYRLWCSEVATHLRRLDALQSSLSDKDATEIMWFFFGFWGLYSLHNENGWSYEQARDWLAQTAARALLKQRR